MIKRGEDTRRLKDLYFLYQGLDVAVGLFDLTQDGAGVHYQACKLSAGFTRKKR